MLRLFALLLPALLPSWRFFKAVQPSPRLEWRDGGQWRPLRAPAPRFSLRRGLGSLFWNPAWNEGLYLVTLSERVIITEDPFAKAELRRRVARILDLPDAALRFRVVFLSRDGPRIGRDVLYESLPAQRPAS